MYQYYVVEIQQYANGEYGHIVHFVADPDATIARNKAESKFHEVLAAAAVSTLPSHAAIMFTSEGFFVDSKCYKHTAAATEPEATAEE